MRPAPALFSSRLLRRLPSRRELTERISAVEKDLAFVMSRLESTKLPQTTDARFLALARDAKRMRRSMLTKSRLWTLWEAVQNVSDLEGAAAEVGSYRGGSARFIASAFELALGHEVPVEVIDTFAGHPQEKLSEHDSAVHKDPTLFTDTSYEDVAEYLSPWEQITVHQGEFSAVAPRLPDRRYRLVHLDVDLYEPMIECLEYFGPRVVPGGVIVVDDYGSPGCPGVDRAVHEFLAAESSFRTWTPRVKQIVLERRAADGPAAEPNLRRP
jgi:O-methyltransferase